MIFETHNLAEYSSVSEISFSVFLNIYHKKNAMK